MSDNSMLLPSGFEDLNCFVEVWAQKTSEGRMNARCTASMADIQAFYDAMTERAEDALSHIETFPIDALPEDSARLFCLVLALAQAHIAIEIHRAVRAPNTPYPHGIHIVRGLPLYG
jgi:hypothetical protein